MLDSHRGAQCLVRFPSCSVQFPRERSKAKQSCPYKNAVDFAVIAITWLTTLIKGRAVDITLHPERSLTLLRCGSTARVIVAPVHVPVAVRVLPDPDTVTSAKPALIKTDAMRLLSAKASTNERVTVAE
jgi:hypothetical protein